MPSRRVAALDGVRGLAILLVVCWHAGLLPGGWIGVSLFFTLSGYLITSLLLEEHGRTGTLSLPSFYRRRAVRLGPALLVALVGTCVLWSAQGGFPLLLPVVLTLLYAANVARAFFPAQMAPTGWAWTLSLEEQFYFVWPPLLRRSLRRGMSRRDLAVRLLTVAATVELARVVLGGHFYVAYSLVRGDDILIGAALALVPVAVPRWLTWAGLAGFATLLVLPLGLLPLSITAAAMCSAVIVGDHHRLASLLCLRPLRYLGRISYALYLWNGVLVDAPIAHWFPAPRITVSLVSVLAAVASTHLLEEPLRRRLAGRRPPASPVLVGAVHALDDGLRAADPAGRRTSGPKPVFAGDPRPANVTGLPL